jgi:hypothetical protein
MFAKKTRAQKLPSRGAFMRVDVIVSRVGERKKTQWKKAGELFRSEMYENSGHEFVAWLFVC